MFFVAQPLIELLDPPRGAMLIMAILAIVLIGVALVACIMIGGRWVRRLSRDELNRRAESPAGPNHGRPIAAKLPKGPSGETVVADARTEETKAD